MIDKDATLRRELEEANAVTDPHRRFHPIRFADGAMDFALQWCLGTVRSGGAEIGEVLAVLADITDGDPDSWANAWPPMADRVAARGRHAAERGHLVSAR
jgi:hypothetical protein